MADDPKRHRVLIVAPSGRDGLLAKQLLEQVGIAAVLCPNVEALCRYAREAVGVCVLAEEALDANEIARLVELVEAQPAWSDLPFVLIRNRVAGRRHALADSRIPGANVTLIDRPLRTSSFISTLRSALRARERQYEAEQAILQRDAFLAMLSHELRNPLAAVTLATDVLREADVGRREVDLIARQTRHLARLIDDLLDVSRVTTGKISLKPQQLALGAVIDAAMVTVAVTGEADRVRIEKPKVDVIVHGDPTRLEQVFTNLIINALKYTPAPGTVTVVLKTEEPDAVIEVRDSGIGIAPEVLPRVFDMFVQADGALARSQGGMGVGLTLVKSLVALHEGTIDAESAGLGQGSIFTVRLPLFAIADAPAPRIEPRMPSASASRSIVVIEDSDDLRETMQLILERAGHTTALESDGLRGYDLVVTTRPDIAFVDIGLPGIDGFEIARRVRAQLGPAVRLVALSGYGQVEDKARALEAGFDAHLTKPIDRSMLLRMAQSA